MAANVKPHRKMLKSETLKIKKKYKDVPEKKEHHKGFEKFAKERYKADQANIKMKKHSKEELSKAHKHMKEHMH